jgi:hypothetical protein
MTSALSQRSDPLPAGLRLGSWGLSLVFVACGDTFYLEGASNFEVAGAHWMRWLQAHEFDGLLDVSQDYVASMGRALQ